MKLHLTMLSLAAALLCTPPAWSAPRKSADKTAAARRPTEKTLTGKLVSVEDSGPGDTYTVATPDGKKVQVTAAPDMERPENIQDGAQVVITYVEVTEPRVSELRLVDGPAFKKRPSSTVQGTLVGYQGGDLGGFIVLEQDGKQENYPTTPNLIGPEKATALTGKEVELGLTPFTTLELRDLKPKA